MATTTVRAKPARTTSKRASSATANASSNTTLTLRLNLNTNARSRATGIAVNNASQHAKPQGGQTIRKAQNGRPAQMTSATNSPPINRAGQNRPRTQPTNRASTASGNGHNDAAGPGPQQQRQSGLGQRAGPRPGNGGNGYIPRPTSMPRQQPSSQDAQRLTSTTGALPGPTSRALAVGNGRGRRA